ncbi:MAG TPA: penicillin-binding protein activator [Syntrophales bacterium]|jgi:ABC-type branched-subunit amino acid transport system substrate-binding protein|nr:penicillin-binding protein activator [Syntrophales bacterium]
MKRFLFIILSILIFSLPARVALCSDQRGFPPVSGKAGEKSTTATIGVILPLSGKYAAYGNRVLDAILMAAAVWDRTNHSRLTLQIRDSESRSETLYGLVQELADREKVILILGPLGEGTEAARLAREKKVPILVFTQQEGIGGENGYVLRDSLTIRQQIQALADHAVTRKGLRRFAMLHPGDHSGREAAMLFREEVTRRGGRILRERTYGRRQADFADEIRSLTGVKGIPGKVIVEPEGTIEIKGSAAVDFEALFLPDSLGPALLTASQLADLQIGGVQMMGLSSWNHPARLRTGGNVLEGAVFTDMFCTNDPSRAVHNFIERYYAATGREPGSLEAMAFDGTNLAVRIILDEKPGSREELRRMILENRDFRGVAGRLEFAPDGESRRSAVILRITQGQIVPVRE